MPLRSLVAPLRRSPLADGALIFPMVLAALVATGPRHARAACSDPSQVFGGLTTYNSPSAATVVAADFDGDGIVDLATSGHGNSVQILLGNGSGGVGDGTFRTGPVLTTGNEPFGLAAGDFNKDGKMDLAVAWQNAVGIYYGSGGGSFGVGPIYPIGLYPIAAYARDLDGDGFLDLITANLGSGTVSVLMGKAGGAFGPATDYPAGAGAAGIAFADFNGDGITDLAVADHQDFTVDVLFGKGSGGHGDGSFSPPVPYTTGNSPHVVVARDLNGDGITDLVASNDYSSNISLLFGNGSGGVGNGTFAPAVNITLGPNPRGIGIGDFNHDGLLDLVVGLQGDSDFKLLPGHGSGGVNDGTFGPAYDFGCAANPTQVIVSDLNNDGELDLVMAGFGSKLSVLFGQCNQAPPTITSFSPTSGKLGTVVTITGTRLSGTTSVTFGAGGNALLSVNSDTQVQAKVDPAATTGRIVLTVGGAHFTSASDFTVLPLDPRPTLTAVKDVPNDQGGHVMLDWLASDYDNPTRRQITGYRIWRRSPVVPAALARAGAADPSRLTDGRTVRVTRVAGTNDVVYWEALVTLPAANLQGYAYDAATTQDSLPDSNPYTAFFVSALTADPFTFYDSAPDSGYSVDNLSPPTPGPFTVTFAPGSASLHWGESPAPDFAVFKLYRGLSADFVPGAGNLVVATRDTGYTDAARTPYYYKLSAVDLHGNPSHYALVTPEGPVPVLAALVRIEGALDHIQITWFAGGNPGLVAGVYRRTEDSGWTQVGSVAADGTGYIVFDDLSVVAGARYGYRLGIQDGAETVWVGEAWAAAAAPRFAFEGLRPNPSIAGALRVSFTLPDAAPARLELFDVSGRLRVSQDVGSLGPGSHVVDLAAFGHVAPGVYLVRLQHGADRATRRAVVLP
jgi:hypothetical protein